MFIVTRRLIFNLFYDPGIIQKLKSTRAFAIVHLQVKVTQQNPPRKRHQAGSMYEWIIVIYLKYKKVQKFRRITFTLKILQKKCHLIFDIFCLLTKYFEISHFRALFYGILHISILLFYIHSIIEKNTLYDGDIFFFKLMNVVQDTMQYSIFQEKNKNICKRVKTVVTDKTQKNQLHTQVYLLQCFKEFKVPTQMTS